MKKRLDLDYACIKKSGTVDSESGHEIRSYFVLSGLVLTFQGCYATTNFAFGRKNVYSVQSFATGGSGREALGKTEIALQSKKRVGKILPCATPH